VGQQGGEEEAVGREQRRHTQRQPEEQAEQRIVDRGEGALGQAAPGFACPVIEPHAYQLRAVDPDDAAAVTLHQAAELHVLDDVGAHGGVTAQARVQVAPEEQERAKRAGDEWPTARHHQPQRQDGGKGEWDGRQQQRLAEGAGLQARNHGQ